MPRAELASGTILDFPDGTDDAVIDRKVLEVMAAEETERAARGARPEATPLPPATPPPSPPGGQSITEGIIEQAPQTAGGVAAGLAATAAGAGFWPVVGMVGLGAGFGESMKQIGQHMSGSLDAPKTSLEAAKRIGKAGMTEAGWEAFGGLVVKGFAKVMAPFRSSMIPGADEVIRHFDDQFRPILLPAEATESRALDLLHNVTSASIVGGGTVSDFGVRRTKFFSDFADGLIDQFGERTDPTDLGNLFVTAVTNKKKVHAKAARVMYNSVKAGRVKIPIKSAKNFAGPLAKRGRKLGGIEAKNAGDDLMDAIMDLPDNLSYKEAIELRSRLIARNDEFSIFNKKAPAIGKTKKMVKIIDRSIGKALKDLPPDAEGLTPLAKWRTANKFSKTGQKELNSTLLRRLIKMADDTRTGAEMIAPAVFKPGKVSVVRQVKKVLDPKDWRKMQGFFMEHLLQKSSTDGEVIGKRLLSNVSGKPGSFGMPMLNEILSPHQLKSLQMFGKAVQLAQKRQSEGSGKVLIQLSQAGAIGALLKGTMELAAGTILIGPALLGKMMTRPWMANLLTRGLTMPAGAEEAAGLMARITAAAYRINRGTKDETE